MLAQKLNEVIEFVSPSDPAVAAVLAADGTVPQTPEEIGKAIASYMHEGFPLDRLQIHADKDPTVWQIRPLSEREKRIISRWETDDDPDHLLMMAGCSIYGLVKVDSLPEGVENPTFREIGLLREINRDWLRNYPNSSDIDYVGWAVFALTFVDPVVLKNSQRPSGEGPGSEGLPVAKPARPNSKASSDAVKAPKQNDQ